MSARQPPEHRRGVPNQRPADTGRHAADPTSAEVMDAYHALEGDHPDRGPARLAAAVILCSLVALIGASAAVVAWALGALTFGS